MDAWKTAQTLLPERLAGALERFPGAEEIRLRAGRSPGVVIGGMETELAAESICTVDLMRVLEKATGASLHTAAPGLRGGYVSFRGLRIGVCGEAVFKGKEVDGLRSFSSLAIRIPHALPAECGVFIEKLLSPAPVSTLIVSPPGFGKTTLLREMIRRTSSRRFRVAVIDERNELSASFAGNTQFDLGPESDVMVGVPKAQAAMMLLRGMNPQIIAMDEITDAEDLHAVEEIAGCGVLVYASAHAADRADMLRRTLYSRLLNLKVFRELVVIRCTGGRRSYERDTLT